MPQGYNLSTAKTFSRIVLIFENDNAYLNDLGTYFDNGAELRNPYYSYLACNLVSGISAVAQGRIRCWLKLGSGPEDQPAINVTDYDPIPASTNIEFYIDAIQTLGISLQAPIKIGFEVFYNEEAYSVFYYEPTPFIPLPTTALASTSATSTYYVVVD